MGISLKRHLNSTVTGQDDRILYDEILDDYGLMSGGSATMSAFNTINVGAASVFVKGTEVTIESEDIAVELSSNGEMLGRLKIVIDYSDVKSPVKFVSEHGTSLPELRQDADVNYINGIYEVEYATYTVNETTISNVALTIQELKSVKEKFSELYSKIDSFDLSGYATKKEVSTAQSKADSAYSLANGKSNALTTAYLTADWSIGANELSKVVEFNVAKSGYTAIGIIGFDISDVGVVSVRGCDLSTGSVARIEITHVNETIYTHSGTASIRVLYVKN